MNKLLTVQEAADYLGCHEQSVYRNKELPFITIPGVGIRFRPEDLDKYIEQHLNKSPSFSSQSIDIKQDTLTLPPNFGRILPGGNSEMPKGKNKTRYNLGYGAIYVRRTKAGNPRYYADYYDRNGKRIQKLIQNASSWEEAQEWLKRAVLKEHHKECGIKEQKLSIKFKDFVEMFIEDYSKVNKASWKDDRYRLQKYINFFGNIDLGEVSPREIERFKSLKIKEGLSKTTVNHYLKILKRLFNIAIAWEYAVANPVERVQLYSENGSKRERILTAEEEICLFEYAPKHLRPILIVALHTGMRRGEILRMKWEDIDFDAREIRVQKTKTGRPRLIDINSTLYNELRTLRKLSDNPYLFINPKTGKPYTKLQKSFDRARKRAGIDDLRFHDLRHTFASRLIVRGVDIIRVKDFLGHTSVKTTERYTHSSREERKEAIELLCQNPSKTVQRWENLLHRRYTEDGKKKTWPASPFFSSN